MERGLDHSFGCEANHRTQPSTEWIRGNRRDRLASCLIQNNNPRVLDQGTSQPDKTSLQDLVVARTRSDCIAMKVDIEVFDLLLEIFELLRVPVSVMCNNYQLNRYLVMVDECVHSTEGGL